MVSALSGFVDVTNHVLGTRSMSWMVIVFVPVFGMVFDVCLKVFSNLYYPTQTQIHMEIESKEYALRQKGAKLMENEPNNSGTSSDGWGMKIEV